ncbi:MAG: hypothetical protein H0X11_10210 [Betaproteobacteria bacterium]|nr:hypothetical protein [Betaproteobacteria bacterium]
MPQYRLSKSKMLSGLQCAKRLYLEIHRPELADMSETSEQAFATGLASAQSRVICIQAAS